MKKGKKAGNPNSYWWPPERREYMRREYPAGTHVETMRLALNQLPGRFIRADQRKRISIQASELGLRRPAPGTGVDFAPARTTVAPASHQVAPASHQVAPASHQVAPRPRKIASKPPFTMLGGSLGRSKPIKPGTGNAL